jgi:tetratricopeptide (TPR) repeat protein
MHLLKADNKYAEAAKQCLLLAALCRMSKNEDAAREYIAEAKQMAPGMDEYCQDLFEFARSNGIYAETHGSAAIEGSSPKSDGEVDLSADLMDIFFTGDHGAEIGDDSELQSIPEVPEDASFEAFPDRLQQPPAKSVPEQMQEVDFYIRLGFHDEALAKLNEIAKLHPDNPELASRYQKLGNAVPDASPGTPEKHESSHEHGFARAAGFGQPEEKALHQERESSDATKLWLSDAAQVLLMSLRTDARRTFPSAESLGPGT